MPNPNDNRKWLYDKLTEKGVKMGTYEQFDKAIDDENNLKWVYDKANSQGLKVGDYNQFSGALKRVSAEAPATAEKPVAETVQTAETATQAAPEAPATEKVEEKPATKPATPPKKPTLTDSYKVPEINTPFTQPERPDVPVPFAPEPPVNSTEVKNSDEKAAAELREQTERDVRRYGTGNADYTFEEAVSAGREYEKIAPEIAKYDERLKAFKDKYGPMEEIVKEVNEGKRKLTQEEYRKLQAQYPGYDKEAKALSELGKSYDAVLATAPGREYQAVSKRMDEIGKGAKTPEAVLEYAQEFSKLQRNPLYRAQLGENAPSEDEIQSDWLQAQIAYFDEKMKTATGDEKKELKKAFSDAKEALYANPYYRKHLEGKVAENKEVSTLIGEELAKRRNELTVGWAAKNGGAPDAWSAQGFEQWVQGDQEMKNLYAAAHMIDDAIREYQKPTKYDDSKGLRNVGKGLADWAGNTDTWSFGIEQFAEDIGVVRPILEKVERLAGSLDLEHLTDSAMDELEKQLTQGEQAVLLGYFEKIMAVAAKGADTSIGYQIGQGIGDMVNLGVEMALTGPVGGAVRKGIDKAGMAAMKKLLTKRMYRQFAKSGVGRVALWTGHKAVRDVAETLVRIPFMPSTYKAIGEGSVELSSDYKTRDFMEYAPEKAFDNFVEQLTEVSNGFAFPLIGKVMKMRGMKNFVTSVIGKDSAKALRTFIERGDIKLLDDMMIGSFGGEWEEELLGAVIHSVTDDPNALRDFFSAEQQLVLLGTLAPIPLARGTVGGVQLAVPAAQASMAWNKAESELKRLGFDDGRIARLKEVVDNASAPEGARAIMQAMKDAGFSRSTAEGQGFLDAAGSPENDVLYGSVPEIDRDAYDALAHYYWRAQQKRAAGLMGEVENDKKVRDKRAELKSKYGQFWHNEMGEEVVETGTIIGADGNPLNVFIASDEPMEDGRVAYVGEDGSNGFLSRDQLVGQNPDGTFAANPETTVTPINIYLAGLVMQDSLVQEAQGVMNEASAANTSLRDQIEGLADVKYKGQSGTITRADDNGAVFVPDEGENVRVTWADLAAENGIQEPEVKTPAERTGEAAALVAEHTRLKQELAGAFRQANEEAGKNGRGALMETEEGTATVVNIISDTIDPENGTAQFTVRMPDGSMNVTMATAIEPVMSQLRGESAPEPEPEPAPAPAPAPGPQPPAGGAGGAEQDFRGNPIPMKDVEVDEEAFREKDPEAWAAWNDALPEGDPRKAILGTKKRLEGLAKASKTAADKAEKDLEKLYDKGATDKEIREKEAEVRDQRARQKRYEDALGSIGKRELDKAEAEREAARKAAEAERLRREKEKVEEEKRKAGKAPDISEDTPEAAQRRGYIMVNGTRIDRPTPDAVAEKGKDTKISFTKSVAVDGKYGLVEASRVEPSHISDQENPMHFFAKKWQPKNRKRADSAVAIQQMANGIRPGEITRGETAYGGAPIVNERGEVIQGNGRSEALRRAYGQGTAAEYKAWLADHAEEFGLTREQVEKMETPILVRVLDVDDARAEQLGKMEQKDLESGGDQRLNGKTLVKKMGKRFGEFLDYLFAGDLGDDATALEYINQNGFTALHWLHQNGFINDTEYANAQDNGKLTEETISAFRAMSIEPLFDNAPEKVRSGFEMLPNSVKLALQRSVATLYGLDGVIGDIQDALGYYYDFETADPVFKKAKNTTEAWDAVTAWMQNVRFDGTSEGEAHPSIVARRFASIFKGGVLIEGEKNPKRTEKAYRSLFTNIASTMRGEGGFMSTAEPTDNIGAYRENNVITEEEENQIRNGKNDNRPGPASGAGENGPVGGQGSGPVRGGRPGGVPERKPAGEGTGPVAPETPANPAPETPAGFGANNKLFTKDARDKAREIMLRKLKGQLNAGIDPEMLTAMIQYCGYYIEAGVRTFVEFAKTAIADLGDAIRPYLKSMYTAVRHYPGMEEYAKEMTPYDEVEKVDVDTIGKEEEPVEEPAEEPAEEPKQVEPKYNEGDTVTFWNPERTMRITGKIVGVKVTKDFGTLYDVESVLRTENPPGRKEPFNYVPHTYEGVMEGYIVAREEATEPAPAPEEKPEEIKENPSESPEKSVTLEGEKEARDKFTDTVAARLVASIASGERPFKSITDLRKAAREAGIEVDDRGATDILIQELTEVAIVRAARKFMSQFNGGLNSRNAFNAICKLYEMQPTISMRSSQRVAMQQYSTPLPMSFVAQMFAYRAGMKGVLEPTAGNGMLVFGIPADKVHANELDDTRKANLDQQGFKEVTQNDATEPFSGKYDAVIANPPFGSHDAVTFDGKSISGLDPVITLRALDAMKDDGKAAIIIGGNVEWADNGSWKTKKAFFAYLYDHYNVKGVVNMAGDMYARQGTSCPTTMILIDGRRSEEDRAKSQVFPPVSDKARKAATTNDELFDIVTEILNDDRKTDGNEVVRTERERKPADRIGQTGSLFAGDDSAEPAENGTNGRGNDGGTVVQGTGSDAVPGKDEPGASTGSRPSGERSGTERDVPAAESGEQAERPADSGGAVVPGPVPGGRTGTDGSGSEVAGVGNAGREQPEPVPGGESSVRKPVRLARKVEDRNLAYVQHSSGRSLESVAPAAMVEAMDAAIQKIEKEQGRTIDEFVTEELGYESTAALHKALAAEQIDSVAMAIYQMKKGKAMIIGDQTGVGKGRQMAALIRWANRQGKKPIFMTQKAGLFSDIYRDLRDIGSGNLKPLILNSADKETDKNTGEKHWKDTAGVMLDEDGKLVYRSPESGLDKIVASGKVPAGYDFVVLTYSQLNSGDQQSRSESKKKVKEGTSQKSMAKAAYVRQIANDNYILLDESHTAAGEGSNSGAFLRSVMPSVKGVTFSSATFAKRPDTMPLYAIKSAMSEANVEPDKLIGMIKKGGVTLQEIMARALTGSGQMVRRERDMSDVRTDWKTVDDPETAKKARANYDRAIEIFNKIISFQRNFITPVIKDISDDLAETMSVASETSGTKNFGVDNPPFVNQTYNFTKQLMLALKAEAIVEEVIKEIKAGRHPVIALENTYESGLDGYNVGDKIEDTSFSGGLTRSFARILQYTVTDPDGNKSQEFLSPEQLGPEAARQYYALQEEIKEATKEIFLSPLDLIKQKLSEQGYKVGEVTGRKTQVVKEDDGYYLRQRTGDAKQAVREFNSGESDVIIINKSGSTGISLHSSVAFKDQRQRSMIIAQPLGDINDYMQMIGRIDRTGQVHRGYYINLSLPVPAETRFNMMLATKLKSLNANTTTSQESDTGSVDAPDFLNKYGSQVVIEYLRDHPEVFGRLVETGMMLGSRPNFVTTSTGLESYRAGDEDAQKVTGRVALLPVEEQEKFYADIAERYNALIRYLDETGENTLKITTLPLKAKTLSRKVGTEGRDPNGNNPFAQNSYVERVEVDVLKKPMKSAEIRKVRENLTGGKSFDGYRDALIERVNVQEKARLAAEEERYARKKEKTQKEIDKQVAALEAKVKGMDEVTRKAEAARITGRLMANLEDDHNATVAGIKSQHRRLREKFEQFDFDETYLIHEELEGGNLIEDGYSPALFLGFKAAKEGDSLTPSTSVAVFATLDGRRRLEIKFTQSDILDEIANFTNLNYGTARETTLDNWDSSISNASREVRYILTGNILQAWDDAQREGVLPGRLVSYTDIDGNIKDGILMNQSWKPDQLRSSGVPINSRTEQILKGESVKSSDGEIEIEHHYGDWFNFYVPKSKKAGGKYWQNEEILGLVYRGNFSQYRGRFYAEVSRENMRALLNILGKMGVRILSEEGADNWEQVDQQPAGNPQDEEGTYFRRLTDPVKIAKLEKEEKVPVYRSALFVPDPNGNVEFDLLDGKGKQRGFLYPPMSVKVDGKFRDPLVPGTYDEAEERPDLATDDGYFWLVDDNGDKMKVAYAPYLHNRVTPLNEQFSAAYRRNLVVIRSLVPKSELESNYSAEKSRKSTGMHDWPSGTVSNALAKEGKDTRKVILSRWAKIGEPVSYAEVADEIVELIGDRDLAFEYNVVSPGLRKELQKRGVRFEGWHGKKPKNVDEIIAGMQEGVSRRGENLRNPIDRAAAITKINEIAKKLGVKFEEDPNLRAKGVFSPKTGKIRINIDAHKDSADLEATLLHEAVAHYGLRKLFGKDWKELRMRLYEQASPEIKARVDAIAKADGLSTEVAMEEYIAQLAEDGRFDEQEESFWQKIVSALKQLLAKIGFNSGYLTDEDFRAMLYASYRNLQTGGALETAARVATAAALRRNAEASHEDNGPEDDGPGGGLPTDTEEDMMGRGNDEVVREVSADLYDRYENQNGEDKPWMSENELIERIEEELPYGIETKELFAKIDEYRRMDEEDFNEGRRDFSGSERDNVFREILAELERLSGETETYHNDAFAPPFFSNAHAALGRIKMDKATPEQWVKMLEKEGGLKAGEDKWIGLSGWLKSQDKKTITKQEIEEYIAKNQIRIEEVRYSENGQMTDEELDDIYNNGLPPELDDFHTKLQNEFDDLLEEMDAYDAYEKMAEKYGERFREAYDKNDVVDGESLQWTYVGSLMELAGFANGGESNGDRSINATRLTYTTKGLKNKREIALTVPTVEPWNQSDDIHFGDAGEGRVVAWVRFGDATDENGRRVLFIDEIQSKRHQEGREQGYVNQAARDELAALEDEYDKYVNSIAEKYNVDVDELDGVANEEETLRAKEYNDRISELRKQKGKIPAAPFEKNWHELAMKRMLRLAAEEGYDYVAWTTGDQQAERYSIGRVVDYMQTDPWRKPYDASYGYKVRDVRLGINGGGIIMVTVNENGDIVNDSANGQYKGNKLSELVGKELSTRLLESGDNELINSDGLRIGGEGMKGFYDDILPRFMNKYGKKWGVSTKDDLVSLSDGTHLEAHMVPVTSEMAESVLQGQAMFRKADLSELPENDREQAEDMEIDQDTEEYYRRDRGYSEAKTADDMYDRKTSTVSSALYTAQVDEYAPLDAFQQAISAEAKKELSENERVSNRLRELGGQAMNEVRTYNEKFLQPMWKAIADLRKAVRGADGKKLSMQELTRYVGLKSGLERNELFAKRDAKKDAKSYYDKEYDNRKAELTTRENEEKARLKARLDEGIISDVTYQGELNALAIRIQQLKDKADADHQANIDNVDNETAAEYRRLYGEYRQKDYSGLLSWFTEEADLKRSDYPSRKSYQRAVNAARKNYIPGVTDLASAEAMAKQIVDDIESRAGSQVIGNLWNRINAATKETLDFQYRKNMISRQQRADISASMKFYIPMRGFEDATAEDLYSYYMKPNVSGFAPTILAAQGRHTRYRSPFGMIGFMHSSAVSQGLKNEAKLELLDFVRRNPKNTVATVTRAWFVKTGETDADGKPIYEVAYPQVPGGATIDERERIIEDFETDMKESKERGEAYNAHREVQMNGGVVAFEKDAHRTEHIVRVMEGGREYGIVINGNPAAAQAVNGIKRQGGYENFLEIMRATRRVLSQMFTTLSIPFWVSNFQRDHGQGGINTFVRNNLGYVGKYIINRWELLPQMIPLVLSRAEQGSFIDRLSPKFADYYRLYLENGGPMGQNRIETDVTFNRQLERYLRTQQHDKAYIANGAHALTRLLSAIGEGVETVTRFATFVTSMEYGRPLHEAIADSKEVSTNFARKGHGRSISWEETGRMETRSGRQLGDTSGSAFETYRNYVDRALIVSSSAVLELLRAGIPFFNAAIQGIKNKTDNYRKNWVKALLADGTYFAIGFAMRYLMGGAGGDDDKEKYGHTSDYTRRNNFLTPLGEGRYHKWALSQEYRYMYALGDITAEALLQEKPYDDLALDAFEALVQVLPAGAVDPSARGEAFWIDAIKSVLPGVVTPIVEAFENKDFKGSRIYDEGFNGNKTDYPGWTKAIDTTGPGYVKAAEWLNKVSGGGEENATVRGSIDFNPAIVEHFVRSYLSGPYQIVGGVGTIVGKMSRGEDIATRDIPVWNRVFMNTNDNSRDAYYSGLYYYFKDRDKEARRLDAGMKGHQTKQAKDFRMSKDYAYMLIFKKYESNERALNQMKKAAQNAGNDDAVKNVELKTTGIRENIAKECLDVYFDRVDWKSWLEKTNSGNEN